MAQCVPIAVAGVAPDSWLNIDGAQVSILGEGDQVLWSDRISEREVTTWTPVRGQLRGDLFETMNGRCLQIHVPPDVLNTVWNRPRRVRVDYSLTLFTQDKSYSMPAWNGDQRMPGVGWCKTRTGPTAELGCLSDGKPACLEVGTPYAPGHSGPQFSCKPDYDAIRDGPDTDPWQVTLPSPASRDDKLVLRTYEPLDHFTRQVTTPEIMPDRRTTLN